MKKYYLFVWNQCYPSGGYNDFLSSHETIEEALKAAKVESEIKYKYNDFHFQIYEPFTNKVICTDVEISPWYWENDEQKELFKSIKSTKV